MILAATQPTYLPWLGFFDLMNQSDLFVVYDHVQFSKQSWQQRNRVRSRDGELMLTVPVERGGPRELSEARIAKGSWQRKHWATLQAIYGSSKHGSEVLSELAPVYDASWDCLVDLNLALIEVGRKAFGITTPMVRSSELALPKGKNEALISLCLLMGADEYYSPAGAREYLDTDRFQDAGVRVRFQDYRPPAYPQGGFPDHMSHLSFVDFLCHAGPVEVAPW